MPEGNALFYSISGVAAARTKELYEELKKLLPGEFPNLKIGFLGCPFAGDGKRKYPIPLLWTPEERDLPPTTRLLGGWKRLDLFTVRTLRPALQKYDIVFVLRFGFDACDYAGARTDSFEAILEMERFHHEIVRARIIAQGIPSPRYFIPIADVNDIGNLLKAFPVITGIDPRILRDLMRHEAGVLERYFDKSTKHGRKQKRPVMLHASLSTEEMCSRVAAVVRRELEKRTKAS